jgi:hypothetical protein
LRSRGSAGTTAQVRFNPIVTAPVDPERAGLWRRGDYFARFKTNCEGDPPTDGDGFVTFNSSPSIVKARVCSVPSQFGYELPSNRTVKVLLASFTEDVPKFDETPWATALFSSGVPVARLFDANLGRSERMSCEE